MISQTSGHGDFRLPQERAHRFGGEISRGELLVGAFIADGRDEVLTATRENLRAGATQIKVMAGGAAASAYDREADAVDDARPGPQAGDPRQRAAARALPVRVTPIRAGWAWSRKARSPTSCWSTVTRSRRSICCWTRERPSW